MVSVFSGKSDEEGARELISWFLPDKKPEGKSGDEDISGEQGSGVEKVSGAGLVSVVNSNDFLTLKGVKCFDHNGKVMEQYDELIVSKDVVRHATDKYEGKSLNKDINFTPYKAIAHFENQKNGLFLPSFALLSNVMLALYDQRDSGSDVKKVLDQFRDYGSGYGWHISNTLVDWKDKKIIHYPDDSDFPECGGNEGINKGRQRREFGFDNKGFGDLVLEDALKKSGFRNYLIDLTGLKKPEVLCDVADYFGKPAMVWVPSNVEKADYSSGAWLGCSSNYFYLSAFIDLYSDIAARGVGAGGAKKRVK